MANTKEINGTIIKNNPFENPLSSLKKKIINNKDIVINTREKRDIRSCLFLLLNWKIAIKDEIADEKINNWSMG